MKLGRRVGGRRLGVVAVAVSSLVSMAACANGPSAVAGSQDSRSDTAGWNGDSVWATRGSRTAGIDTRHAAWTVLAGRSNGPGETTQPPLLTRTVTRVEYVGLAH